MKKSLFVVAIAIALVGCKETTDYKAMGEQFSTRLMDLCQKNDTAAVLALNDSIQAVEDEIVAAGDTIAAETFRNAVTEARQQCAPFITVAKMQSGMTKDEAVKNVVDKALEGEGDVTTVTKSIQAALEKESQENR